MALAETVKTDKRLFSRYKEIQSDISLKCTSVAIVNVSHKSIADKFKNTFLEYIENKYEETRIDDQILPMDDLVVGVMLQDTPEALDQLLQGFIRSIEKMDNFYSTVLDPEKDSQYSTVGSVSYDITRVKPTREVYPVKRHYDLNTKNPKIADSEKVEQLIRER